MRSLDALWAMKTANGGGLFDYYDLYITLSGTISGYFDCSAIPGTTTTTTTTLAPDACVVSGFTQVSLRYDASSAEFACTGGQSTYYLDGGTTLDTSTQIYYLDGGLCIFAPAGHYSNNIISRQWSGIGWQGTIDCL